MAELIAPEIALLVTNTLEEIGVPYLIGGSLASITHGVMRSTLDADIVAELQPDQIMLCQRAESRILCGCIVHSGRNPASEFV